MKPFINRNWGWLLAVAFILLMVARLALQGHPQSRHDRVVDMWLAEEGGAK